MANRTQPLCLQCFRPYRFDAGEEPTVDGAGSYDPAAAYREPPYNWDPAKGYCLFCWLVGPVEREHLPVPVFREN